MCEFDSGLRLRLFIDYEALTGLKLRPIFKQIDSRKKGFVVLEDFETCLPQVWQKYGTEGRLCCVVGFPSGHRPLQSASSAASAVDGGAAAARSKSPAPRDTSRGRGGNDGSAAAAGQPMSPETSHEALGLILAAMERAEASAATDGQAKS
mmetsp:Transcript_8567/g.19078  ORF Transcript_8567/g.19078 Transcript_8567/m.19078 type:complete len:151 (+) Transcript_8567:2-454(+)